MHSLALVRLDRGEFNDALALNTRALEVRRRVGPTIQERGGQPRSGGVSLIRLKRFDTAEKHLAEALTIREAHADEAPLALARTLEFVGLMHRLSGRSSRCRASHRTVHLRCSGNMRPVIPISRPPSRFKAISASSPEM
jgi:hypothetical protein